MRLCMPMFMGAMGEVAMEARECAGGWVMLSCSTATTGLWSEALSGDMWYRLHVHAMAELLLLLDARHKILSQYEGMRYLRNVTKRGW